MLTLTPAVTITQYYYIPETKLFLATALRTSNSMRMRLLGITMTLKVANVYKLMFQRVVSLPSSGSKISRAGNQCASRWLGRISCSVHLLP
jgi:hypothetical protein